MLYYITTRLKYIINTSLSFFGYVVIRLPTSPDNGQTLPVVKLVPDGHYYSPIAQYDDLRRNASRIWCRDLYSAIWDSNYLHQLKLLEIFSHYVSLISFSHMPTESEQDYYYSNDQFSYLDANVLFCFLAHLQPKTYVEIGSGYSTLVAIKALEYSSTTNITCIEPYPRAFLRNSHKNIVLIESFVQDIPGSLWATLVSGDVLFIDSSHVLKIDSDLHYIYFTLLPQLAKGVFIHFHDIFLPDNYPQEWMIEQARHWNEQYFLLALLQGNSNYRVVWSSYYMGTRHTAEVQRVFRGYTESGGGGSLWLEKMT